MTYKPIKLRQTDLA